jgi:hypothetical protein
MAAGVTRHETRHWSTTYRGALAIHSAKTLDVAGAPEDLCRAALGRDWRLSVPRGAIVAVGELTACRDACRVRSCLTSADLEAGNFNPGRFAWRVDNLRALKTPIAAVGRQGLWNWTPPADLEVLLTPHFDHAEAARLIGWA